ncbi:hypothetical protein A2Z22_04765 [Candidatus Woesebacteria bacterium RBG_16_34_12]|uniref:AAA domain-containing protein n=1 Tax=Candidatus Woesebacteria bacterium RBG_16_34_12 TaxID=1802480 RepID=A0A1F7XCB7_9BACT|nr:MAG: hypothetical protein A2Z22_04765 [Candidatus Woesebacteria bacterium RBG_16_34_12]
MYVHKLIVKNFRCFDNSGIEIDFEDGLTGIIGKNGCGKTTIIEALNYVFGREYLQNKINEKDFHNRANKIKDKIEIVAYTKHPFFVNADVTYSVGASTYRQSAQILIACNGLRLTIKRREKAERVLDDPFIIDRVAIPLEGSIDTVIYDGVLSSNEKPITKAVLSPDVGYFNVTLALKSGEERQTRLFEYQLTYNPSKYKKFPIAYFLSKDREREVANTYSILSKILTDIHWRYRKTQEDELDEFSSKYADLATHLRKVDEKGILISSINSTIEKVTSENGDFSIDFFDTNEPYKGAFLSKNIPYRQLLPVDLGSGYHILFAYALAKYIFEIEKEPVVFLIDEPEMHLHSDWQTKLFSNFLSERDIQVIYSTQSENLLSLKYWKNIRVLRSGKAHPSQASLDQLVQFGSTTHKVQEFIQDYADRNLHISTFLRENLELFFTKKCILVEGPSEKYALPKLLNLIGCDVSHYSVSIIPVWGKGKLKQYQLLCKCFGVNYFTVYDEDRKNGETYNNDEENNSVEANVIQNQVYKFPQSFESSLGVNDFQGVATKIEGISSVSGIDISIIDLLNKLRNYIESNLS